MPNFRAVGPSFTDKLLGSANKRVVELENELESMRIGYELLVKELVEQAQARRVDCPPQPDSRLEDLTTHQKPTDDLSSEPSDNEPIDGATEKDWRDFDTSDMEEERLEECFNSASDDSGSITRSAPTICGYCGERGHGMKKCRKQKKSAAELARGKCHYCGKKGHKARKCPQRMQLRLSGASDFMKKCTCCKGEGHYSSDCPLSKKHLKAAKNVLGQ